MLASAAASSSARRARSSWSSWLWASAARRASNRAAWASFLAPGHFRELPPKQPGLRRQGGELVAELPEALLLPLPVLAALALLLKDELLPPRAALAGGPRVLLELVEQGLAGL